MTPNTPMTELPSDAELVRTMREMLETFAQIAEERGFKRGDDLAVRLIKNLPPNGASQPLRAPPLNKSPTPEHVEGDVLSVGMEATRWSAIGVGQMAADPEGRWVSIRDFDQARSAEAQLADAVKVLAEAFEFLGGVDGAADIRDAMLPFISTIGEKPDAE